MFGGKQLLKLRINDFLTIAFKLALQWRFSKYFWNIVFGE